MTNSLFARVFFGVDDDRFFIEDCTTQINGEPFGVLGGVTTSES